MFSVIGLDELKIADVICKATFTYWERSWINYSLNRVDLSSHKKADKHLHKTQSAISEADQLDFNSRYYH